LHAASFQALPLINVEESQMKRCLPALAIACLTGSAMADVTYSYTGRPLTVYDHGDLVGQIAPLTIMLDFSSDGSALLDWSISQPDMGTIDPSNVFPVKTGNIGDSPAIYFYTDASGAVTSWYVGAEVLDPNGPPGTWWAKLAQSWYGVVLGSPPLPVGIYAEEVANTGFNADQPGTWTSAGGVLRNFAYGDRADLGILPVPEPSSSWLALAGMGALVAWRKAAAREPQARSR
jgi:hypothetical protein